MNKPGTPQPQRARIWKSLRTITVILLTLLIIVRVTGVAEQLAYWPTRDTPPTPSAYEDVWISTPDGVTLHAWLMPAINVAPNERAPAILHVHGNAGNIGHHESFSSFLTNHGMHVLLFDYRCYGKSDETGSLSRERLAIDTNAALDALLDHPRVDPDRVGVLGVSLGGPFAMNAAANEPRVRAVATLSTFSSWAGVASDMSPLAPLLFPSGDPAYDPIKAVNALNNRPYLILHGDNDQIVSPRHADLLYQQATNAGVDAKLARYPGDHNALVQINHDARNELIKFFHAHLGTQSE